MTRANSALIVLYLALALGEVRGNGTATVSAGENGLCALLTRRIPFFLVLKRKQLADGMRTIGSACVNNANSGIEPNLVHQFVFNDFAEGDATATFVSPKLSRNPPFRQK